MGYQLTGTVCGMNAASKPPWWEAYNNGARSLHDTGWADLSSMLSNDICALLDHVDATFALTGAHTPGWPNPYQDGLAPDEHAYERITDPDKFQIVEAHHLAIRTSFGVHTSRPVPDLDTPTAFTAAPWPPNWNARPLVPNIDTHRH